MQKVAKVSGGRMVVGTRQGGGPVGQHILTTSRRQTGRAHPIALLRDAWGQMFGTRRAGARGRYVPAGMRLSDHGALPLRSRRHLRQQARLEEQARRSGAEI